MKTLKASIGSKTALIFFTAFRIIRKNIFKDIPIEPFKREYDKLKKDSSLRSE